MRIKGANGEEYNVTSQGQGNFNTVGGAAGIAALLGIDLSSILGNRYNGNMNGNELLAALAASKNGANNAMIEGMMASIMMLLAQGGHGRNNQVDVITSDDKPISRYEARMMDENSALKSENALLKSNVYTDQKIVEATRYLDGKINDLAVEVRRNKEQQCDINREQAVYNGTNTAAVGCLRNQVRALEEITQLVIPSRHVCDTGCCCNGNGN